MTPQDPQGNPERWNPYPEREDDLTIEELKIELRKRWGESGSFEETIFQATTTVKVGWLTAGGSFIVIGEGSTFREALERADEFTKRVEEGSRHTRRR